MMTVATVTVATMTSRHTIMTMIKMVSFSVEFDRIVCVVCILVGPCDGDVSVTMTGNNPISSFWAVVVC